MRIFRRHRHLVGTRPISAGSTGQPASGHQPWHHMVPSATPGWDECTDCDYEAYTSEMG